MIVPYGILEMIFYWPFHEFDIAAFCMDIMCIRPLYANGWYLSYMLLWYVLFYLIMRLRALEKYRCQAFFAISLFLFFYFGNRSPIRAEQSLSFFAGFILAEYEDSEIIRNKITLKTGILMFALGIAFLAIKQLEIIRDAPAIVFNFVQLMIKLPCALGILIGVWMTSRKINLRFFQWVGMLSFDIYIIHGYLLEKTEVNYCGAIMFILLTTVCSVLFWLIMNKTRNLQKTIMRV